MSKGDNALIALNPTESGPVHIYLTTLSGILVWDDKVDVTASVQKAISWDPKGTENKIESIKSGIYVLIAKGAGIDVKKKFAIIK